MTILELEHLSFTYAGAAAPVLREVSFSLEAGDFALLTGETGCGKSTLLRLLKRELAPRGSRSGVIRFQGQDPALLSPREAAASIGFVFQRPEEQIVTDRVWHELAFGLENLGVPPDRMRRRIAEAAQFFGLEEVFDLPADQLSGGQKQLLNLAAATVLEPDLLLLDEPTAHLDPISAKSFLSAVRRLNRETGMTLLLADHHLEDCLSQASRLILMEQGRVTHCGAPREVCGQLPAGSPLSGALPAPVRLWQASGQQGTCPLSAGEGRVWASSFPRSSRPENAGAGAGAGSGVSPAETETEALSLRDVWFRFHRNSPDILRSLNFHLRAGEIFALLGGNGSGKTTFLRVAAGLLPPMSGEVRFFGRPLRDWRHGTLRHQGVALLPQDVQPLFLKASVREELHSSGLGPGELPFDLSPLLDRHPYDLSGGEQQLLALAKVLAGKPRLLLMDEPTSGLDASWRKRIQALLRDLQARGVTILLVTHDAEFASACADRCGLLFRGRVEAADAPHPFFAGGSFYVPPISRVVPGALSVPEAAALLGFPASRP